MQGLPLSTNFLVKWTGNLITITIIICLQRQLTMRSNRFNCFWREREREREICVCNSILDNFVFTNQFVQVINFLAMGVCRCVWPAQSWSVDMKLLKWSLLERTKTFLIFEEMCGCVKKLGREMIRNISKSLNFIKQLKLIFEMMKIKNIRMCTCSLCTLYGHWWWWWWWFLAFNN